MICGDRTLVLSSLWGSTVAPFRMSVFFTVTSSASTESQIQTQEPTVEFHPMTESFTTECGSKRTPDMSVAPLNRTPSPMEQLGLCQGGRKEVGTRGA